MYASPQPSRSACEVVPTLDIYAEGPRVLVLDGRRVVYEDNDHLTDFGTSLAAGRIEAAIARALAAGSPASRAAGDGR